MAELQNTVRISKECASDIFDAVGAGLWDAPEDLLDDGYLYFNPDHNEHMDFIDNDVIKVLCNHRVSGDICFGSLEGDNKGSFWGYRFDGKGGMCHLEGVLSWREKRRSPLQGKRVAFTGALESMSRKEAAVYVRSVGGIVVNTINKNTDLVVIGTKPGTKLLRALELSINTATESVFRTILGL